MKTHPRFCPSAFRLITRLSIWLALALPLAAPPSGLAQVMVNPEPGALTGGIRGHTATFRQATPVFGPINTVDDAATFLGYTLPNGNVAFEAFGNGTTVINYTDTNTNPRPQQNFGNDLDIRRVPGALFGPGDQDNYAARFSGYIYIPEAGSWNFTINSDEGFRLRMGTANIVVLESPNPKLPGNVTGAVLIPSPGFYHYELIWFERTGGSEIEFFANGPGQPTDRLVGDTSGSTLQVFQTLKPLEFLDLGIQFVSRSNLLLTWTNSSVLLEETSSLTPTNRWQITPLVPTFQSNYFTISLINTGASRFFRLRYLPPDPAAVAPPIDPTVTTSISATTEFLYTGANPIQTGVVPGTIDARRAAVLRGKTSRRNNTPLSGVAISILNHPELGQTFSRADGMFDLVVNGGGLLTVKYEKTGFCPVQRQINVPWQDYVMAQDVVMIQMDPIVTTVALDLNAPMQTHQGSMQTDSDGARQATVLIPPGTTAEMVLPDGSTQAITSLSLRATEFTVGTNGPRAMPGELPPMSAYTYCVELSADEAMAVGATDVRFSAPLPFYIENFLGLPVGTGVPLGSYDRTRGVWLPADNGKVIKILSVTAAAADLDITGDGLADTGAALAALAITDAERQRLAMLYPPGQSLWRVLIPHFTPWDLNFPYGLPDGAVPPGDDPEPVQPCDSCTESGSSVIDIQNQLLGEVLGVVGTGFGLHYQSDRVPGYRVVANTLEIPLAGPTPPTNQILRRIELEIQVAGRLFESYFGPEPNQRTTFEWDGQDAYGRTLQGAQPVTVRIGYTYGAVYREPVAFGGGGSGGGGGGFGSGGASAISGSRARQELTLWRTWTGQLGAWNGFGAGIGGWALSAHHAYDPSGRVLYRGDGRRESARDRGPTIDTYAGTGVGFYSGDGGQATQADVSPFGGLAVGPDGSLYIATASNRIRRVAPDGIITTVVGNGTDCSPSTAPCGDGGPATQAQIASTFGMAVGPDNSLYISSSHRVRKVSPDGIITTIAGTGLQGFSGDGGPGHLARINSPVGLAVGPDGGVYFVDSQNARIRRVGPDGIITTVAGSGFTGFSGDGGPATLAGIGGPRGLAVGRDGTIYISDPVNQRVRRVTPDGIIRTIAGTGVLGFSGDEGPATAARLSQPIGIAVAADGTVYFVDAANRRVRLIHPDGTINTLAGTGANATSGDGGLARLAALQNINFGLAVGPDGAVYVSQQSTPRVRRISPIIGERFIAGELVIPAADGSEIFLFTGGGRHLRTLDALTGALRYQFAYDGAGRLASVTDGDGNVTSIGRDGQGSPTTIVGPFGQLTALETDTNGYLSRVTNPAGEAVQLAHTTDGLLTGVTWPGGQASGYAYDPLGRLAAATDPTGATKTLTRTGINRDFTVTLTSPLGRATTHRVERLRNGDLRLTTTDCASGQSQAVTDLDGHLTGILPDGTTLTNVLGPDPRWGMRAPLVASQTTATSNGLVNTLTTRRTATLAGPGQLLSLRALNETVTINGRAWTNTYDGTNRTFVSTSPGGRRGRMILDERGRPAQAQHGNLDPIAFTYDNRGRLASASQGQGPGARIAVFAYGPDGFLASVTDPLGRTTTFTNDPAGRVTAQTLPDGRVVRFAYDANGNGRGVTPPGRPEHAFTYNLRDDVAAYTPPVVGGETNETRFTYDADRKPTRIDQPNGGAVQFQYQDGTCHLSFVDLGTRQRTYGYNAAGQLISLGASQGISLAYAYEGGLFTSATWSGAVTGSVAQTYDSDFRVAALRVNGADPVAILYAADSLPVQVGGLVLTRSPETGFVTNTTLGALSDTVSFDGFGDLASHTASHNGSAVYAAGYTRDLLGRLNQKTETLDGPTRVFDYTYDLAGRLSEVRQDGILAVNYSYDPNGNRLSRTDPGGTLNATYDAQDRLLQYGSTTYEYNAKGERVNKLAGGQTTTYQYEALGNLTGVTLPDGTQIEYLLDAQDRRVGRRVNGLLGQAFLYQDGLRPIAELDGAGVVVSRFVYATGRNIPDYLVKGGVTYRIITDHLGSPRLVLDVTTGQVAQRMEHDEFGRVTLDTNPGFQPFGFAGGIQDPQTGLLHFGAREYDPETGRWTTKDPIGFGGGDGNLYAYVGSEPVNNVDPSGLCITTVDCTCTRQPATCAAAGITAKGVAVAVAPVATAVAVAAPAVAKVVQTVGPRAAPIVRTIACRGGDMAGLLSEVNPWANTATFAAVQGGPWGTGPWLHVVQQATSLAPAAQNWILATQRATGGRYSLKELYDLWVLMFGRVNLY